MTDVEKKAMLTSMTKETDDTALSTYLALAKDTVLRTAYPYGAPSETVPAQYEGVQVEIAAYMLNKRGAEGETAHSENGVARSYEDGGVPRTLLRKIVPMVGVL